MARLVNGVLLACALTTSAVAQNMVVTPGVGDTQFSPGTRFWFYWQSVTAEEPPLLLRLTRCDPRRGYRLHRSHRRSDRCIRR